MHVCALVCFWLQEYLLADSSPEAVLVAGWSEAGFMGQLLWELDQGQNALPPGGSYLQHLTA